MSRVRGMVAMIVALLLTGCVGLPDAGSVQAGTIDQDSGSSSGLEYIAEAPAPGASQEDIVLGFLQAAISPSEDFAIAREYLAGPFQSAWNPNAGVSVRTGQPAVVETGADKLDVTTDVAGFLDRYGRYRSVDGDSTRLEFTLTAVDGEWRIASGPDGIVLTAFYFERLFETAPLTWYSDDRQWGVADVRWFPVSSTDLAEHIVDSVVVGPAEWLASVVWTADPDGATRTGPVQFDNGVATVGLANASSLAQRPGDMAMLAAEIRIALRSAGISVSEVLLSIGSITVSSAEAPPIEAAQSGPPIGIVDGALQVLEDGSSTGLDVADAIVQHNPLDASVLDSGAAGVSLNGTDVRYVNPGQSRVIDSNVRIAPVIDRFGFAWWLDGSGAIVAGNGIDRVTLGPAGDSRVIAMSLSRDGSRLAVMSETQQGSRVLVFGIVRDRDDAPESLAMGVALPAVAGNGVDVSWMDAASLVIVAVDDGQVSIVDAEVGGASQQLVSPSTQVTQVVGNDQGIAGVRLLATDGSVLALRGGEWTSSGGVAEAELLVTRV